MMSQAANPYDIEFYNLVHALQTAPRTQEVLGERRRRNRQRFGLIQRISPIRGESDESSATEYISVPCCDLNAGGFSFLLPHPPDFRQLVVALGRPPGEILVLAAVAHWRPEEASPGKRRPMYHVGCRFVRRLSN